MYFGTALPAGNPPTPIKGATTPELEGKVASEITPLLTAVQSPQKNILMVLFSLVPRQDLKRSFAPS